MVKTRTLACFLLLLHVISGEEHDFDAFLHEGLNLLQLRASTAPESNSSRGQREAPGEHERAQCPHEIEAELAASGDKRFGCEGKLRAEDTVRCSFWGEPHVTELFTGRPANIDVLYKSGLFRMGAAVDGSWEVQVFNCGIYASAVAARFGKTLIEVFVDKSGTLTYYLNGENVDKSELPTVDRNGVKLDSTHRTIHTDSWTRPPAHYPGTCADDIGGQISLDVAADLNAVGNLNVKLEAARDSVTTVDTDKYSICNVHARAQWRWGDWETLMVEPENSLFTIGTQMCAGCNGPIGWGFGKANLGSAAVAREFCDAHGAKDVGQVTVESICRGASIAVADAAAACASLQDRPQFYQDCQIDYCASGGEHVVVEEAAEEEAIENPQPRCVQGDCDPASLCCNALKDQATLILDNVIENELCGGGELRYGSALNQNGQSIDLVVRAVGEIECSGKLDDSKFGSKNSQIGIVAVNVGSQQTYEFSFVQHGTDNLVAPQNLMMTFLDIDQGKNGKQRESIEVCGGGAAVTTDDSELDISVNGDCIKVMSTTAGTGRDNPDNLEGMSQLQRQRTVAHQVKGSSLTATLAVSKKGNNPRRFLFAGHPSVACVLK